jgi:hypothetical protein
MHKYLLTLFALIWPMLTNAQPSFVADVSVQQSAETHALDAVNYSEKRWGVKLDWTDGSIAHVEKILALVHKSFVTATPKPTEDQAMGYATIFGSYIGEVYRRNHGAEWGMVSLGGQQFPGLQTKSGVNFWPSVRALKRITGGAENNVEDYYRLLLTK